MSSPSAMVNLVLASVREDLNDLEKEFEGVRKPYAIQRTIELLSESIRQMEVYLKFEQEVSDRVER